MFDRLAPRAQYALSPRSLTGSFEERFDGFVAYEEERCAGRGADECGADACVDTAEAAGGIEACGGLEAGFEGVDWVEGEVDCCAC